MAEKTDILVQNDKVNRQEENMRKKQSWIRALITLIIVLAAATGLLGKEDVTTVNEGAAEQGFAVHFLDVGQADAALVQCENRWMLIDGGNGEDSNLIAAYLKKQGISYLDYIVCSHAHEDHVGGLSGALSVAEVGEVYAPETGADTRAYKNFKAKVKEQGLTIQHPVPGDSIRLGQATILFLGPVEEDKDDINNTSIMLKITYGQTAFLFTGDGEREEELSVLDTGLDVSATVLKVGHHGSSTSTSYPFLRAVNPEYAVISVGKGNDYGHPHQETISRLSDADTKLYRTDELGDIIMTSDGYEISVRNAR